MSVYVVATVILFGTFSTSAFTTPDYVTGNNWIKKLGEKVVSDELSKYWQRRIHIYSKKQ